MKKKLYQKSLVNRISIIFILSILCIYSLSAQIDEEIESPGDRFFFGGNISLSFGTITDIEISPQVGYYISKRWASGLGVTYEYYQSNISDIKTHIYGGSVFTRYFLFPDISLYFPVNKGLSIFGQAEYMGLSLEKKYFKNSVLPEDQEGRFLSHNYLLGGGFMQKLSKKGGIYIMILFVINETGNTSISNPVIRIGFNF